nr:immunoglobulin light chain junction region [Macaca mulatta]
CQQYNDLLISF